MRAGVLVTIGALCLMATIDISSNGSDIDPRAFGVGAVLYLLGTVLLPLLRRRAEPPEPEATPMASDLLRRSGHVLVEGPVRRGGSYGPGQNVCLRDPDGNLIEVITYDSE